MVGVAPNASILAYKVCRSDGTCSDFAIAQAAKTHGLTFDVQIDCQGCLETG